MSETQFHALFPSRKAVKACESVLGDELFHRGSRQAGEGIVGAIGESRDLRRNHNPFIQGLEVQENTVNMSRIGIFRRSSPDP